MPNSYSRLKFPLNRKLDTSSIYSLTLLMIYFYAFSMKMICWTIIKPYSYVISYYVFPLRCDVKRYRNNFSQNSSSEKKQCNVSVLVHYIFKNIKNPWKTRVNANCLYMYKVCNYILIVRYIVSLRSSLFIKVLFTFFIAVFISIKCSYFTSLKCVLFGQFNFTVNNPELTGESIKYEKSCYIWAISIITLVNFI